jgi:hypothetical protein
MLVSELVAAPEAPEASSDQNHQVGIPVHMKTEQNGSES